MTTLQEYRQLLGWSLAELARQAHIDTNTARKAESGEVVSGRTGAAIAKALSQALGRTIRISDIEGLEVKV
jgi:transcriptional regulator with XRE-family HTH domain